MITIEDQITQVEIQIEHIARLIDDVGISANSYQVDRFLELSAVDADYRQTLATLNQVQLFTRMANELEEELDLIGEIRG